jgi:AcrR family transcriptional regulator
MPRRPDLARRTELAYAAFEVLCARGMQTSMRELADALGVKRPTLYFYFPDFEAVFETVLEQTYRTMAVKVAEAMRGVEHPLDRLRAVVSTTIAFHRAHPQLIAGLFQLWAMGGRDVSTILDRERRTILMAREALIADLRGGIARREVKPCDPARIVEMVLAVIDGVLVHHVLGIARPDHVIEDLDAHIIEPLRLTTTKKKKASKQ